MESIFVITSSSSQRSIVWEKCLSVWKASLLFQKLCSYGAQNTAGVRYIYCFLELLVFLPLRGHLWILLTTIFVTYCQFFIASYSFHTLFAKAFWGEKGVLSFLIFFELCGFTLPCYLQLNIEILKDTLDCYGNCQMKCHLVPSSHDSRHVARSHVYPGFQKFYWICHILGAMYWSR